MTYDFQSLFPFPAGSRVRFTETAHVWNLASFQAGECGTVGEQSGSDDDCYFPVELDTHRPELEEWDNEVHFHFTDGNCSSETHPGMIELVIAAAA